MGLTVGEHVALPIGLLPTPRSRLCPSLHINKKSTYHPVEERFESTKYRHCHLVNIYSIQRYLFITNEYSHHCLLATWLHPHNLSLSIWRESNQFWGHLSSVQLPTQRLFFKLCFCSIQLLEGRENWIFIYLFFFGPKRFLKGYGVGLFHHPLLSIYVPCAYIRNNLNIFMKKWQPYYYYHPTITLKL